MYQKDKLREYKNNNPSWIGKGRMTLANNGAQLEKVIFFYK